MSILFFVWLLLLQVGFFRLGNTLLLFEKYLLTLKVSYIGQTFDPHRGSVNMLERERLFKDTVSIQDASLVLNV